MGWFFLAVVRIIGPLLMWTTQTAMALETWRAENGSRIAIWLDAISEFEALAALANYAWEHPGDPFPILAEKGPVS